MRKKGGHWVGGTLHDSPPNHTQLNPLASSSRQQRARAWDLVFLIGNRKSEIDGGDLVFFDRESEIDGGDLVFLIGNRKLTVGMAVEGAAEGAPGRAWGRGREAETGTTAVRVAGTRQYHAGAVEGMTRGERRKLAKAKKKAAR